MRQIVICMFVFVLAACQPIGANVPSASPAPVFPTLSITAAPPPIATRQASPAPTAGAPGSTGGQVVTFKTGDDVLLGGSLYGSGPRAVILSNIGSGTQADWQEVPALLAERGYMVLTYDWRGFGASGGSQDYVACVPDLAAAIDFVRAQGATRIILIGGSLGGIASLKQAHIPELAGLVVIGAPRNAPQLAIRDEEIAAITAPKLFVGSALDAIVPYTETTAMFAAAVEPKTLQAFTGSAHGTDILKSSDHDALVKRLLDFVQASLPRLSQSPSEFTGSYVIAPDRFISIFLNGDALMYRDFKTGRLGALRPVGEDAFGAGPAGDSTVRYTRSPAGHVTGLRLRSSAPDSFVSGKRLEGFFTEREVRFRNGDISLAGTLLVPATPGTHPALVVLSGSNPASRKDIAPRIRAEFLAYHGFAVLLYDKRGVGDSSGRYQELASDDNIDNLSGDGLAAVQFLQLQPDINPRQIGLYGSSQAGWIAPRIAVRSSAVAFMLLLSGPTVSPSQQDYYLSLRGQGTLSDAEITQKVLERGPQDFDPRPYLVKATIPSLWIFGGLDERIPSAACIVILQQLQQAGHQNLTYHLFPTANHSLYDVAPGSLQLGVVSGLDDTIIDWLVQQVKADK